MKIEISIVAISLLLMPNDTGQQMPWDLLSDSEEIYNPHPGYEPYWKDGDVLQQPRGLGRTTTPVPMVCGDECGYMYRRLKHVCGRQTLNFKMDSDCGWLTYMRYNCTGATYNRIHAPYWTFNTYCEFLDAQCRSADTKRWVLAYFGKCVNWGALNYFKPIHNPAWQITSRVPYYLSLYTNQLTTTTPKIGIAPAKG